VTSDAKQPPASRGEDSIHWKIEPTESYGGYLDLERLLSAQRPRSDEHDELLFIIVHQTAELWMKQSLHELNQVVAGLHQDRLDTALKGLARIAGIQRLLIQSWDVLSTLTPHDYVRLRPHLGPSSGFQSWQYRALEFALGNKDAGLIEVHRSDAARHAELETFLNKPSLYDEALRLLARRGIALPASVLERDWRLPYVAQPQVEEAWLVVYRDVERWWDLYDLAEKLVDLEDRFQQWRFRHMTTVERIIGRKTGTGGSSGVPYLAKALSLRFFPELWSLRTQL
jgi:tryptophan 2,3-dioxygenase